MKNFRSRKLKIEIFALIIAFVGVVISPFYYNASVKASEAFTFPYLFTDYEYRQIILDKGLSQDPIYNSDGILPVFCDFSSFTDWNQNSDYTSYVKAFADFLETDSTFQSFQNLGNMVIAFDGTQQSGVFRVFLMSSERPLYVCGKNYYSFTEGITSDFSTNYMLIRYSYYQGDFSFVAVESSSNNYLGGGNVIDGTLFKMNAGSDFNTGIVYSDAVVRCKYKHEGNSLDDSDGTLQMNYNLHFAAELSNWEGYPVCELDRRTLFPDFLDSQLSEDDRYINEHSRCGLKNYSFYAGGTVINDIKSYLQYELNEYTKLNKDHCAIQISYDFSMDGSYRNLAQPLADNLAIVYGANNNVNYQFSILNDLSSFYGQQATGQNIIEIPLKNAKDFVNAYEGSITNYFSNMEADTITMLYDSAEISPKLDKFISAMCMSYGYSYKSNSNVGGSLGIGILSLNFGSGSSIAQPGNITKMQFICKCKIVDKNDSTKDSMQATFIYNALTGTTTTDGSIVYDDSDIIDKKDDPDYEVPTTPTTEYDPTQPTTQTVITTGGGTVTVSNSNVNNNNPEIHVAPSINVYADGGGSGTATTNDVVIIQDDDSIEETDVQDVVDNVENFLDFGDTFYDEYMSSIFTTIPTAVWRPFAICTGFIALASMIAFVLRR